ncbi:flagellar hook assembly protein FlgD [Methylosinus sp. Sm6]|uniref:flagellar hook assembly protein FlgD n=1 Tax=Methylosinus sp. Sm6 TaxID=2866948 RepID=UPI001C991F69|nr:flagellar hook assembly protein FlgD [Methylosinus sp. Sm6]
MQVTSTNAVTTATSTSSTSTTGSSASLGYDQFLMLLVTEMQNQDPTNPMDSTETVSQLASFSAVEQAVKTNETLTSLLASSSLTQAQSFIGKTVTSADGSVKGVVASVTIGASGQTATLTDGRTVDLTTGITVS